MGSPNEALSRLGRHVDEELAALSGRDAPTSSDRERFVTAALAIRNRAPRRRVPRARAVAFAAALAASLLLFALLRQRPLSFRVGPDDAAAAGVLGAWIATPSDRPTRVRFS